MNKNQNVAPIFADIPSSCLTNQDLLLAGVTSISLNLKSLLIRPGKELLKSIPNIRNFFAWKNHLVLNCSLLEPNAQNIFNIISEIDGSKFTFSVDEILELIDNLDVDIVIYPRSLNQEIPHPRKETKIFMQKKHQNEDECLDFINKSTDVSRYLVGHFSLNLLAKFKNSDGLFIENHKPATDGYHGIFYRDMQEHSILSPIWEFDFSRLDDNCNCYTCSSAYTCSYLHHLLQNTPLLAQRLLILHNVFYINHLP